MLGISLFEKGKTSPPPRKERVIAGFVVKRF